MNEINQIENRLSEISGLLATLDRNRNISVEKNTNYFKILAKVKCDLERALKNPSLMLSTVMNCVDACREVTPYYSVDAQKNKIDPPLSEEEKTQYINKFEEFKEKK
jgi:hypothetical protein